MNDIDQRDDFENAYLSILRTLRVLAASAEQACDLQGHYNVAFETMHEAQSFPYIFNLPYCPLTSDQRLALEDILTTLKLVPPEVLTFTDVLRQSLQNMKHPSWNRSREKAKLLLESLKTITAANTWYFEQDRVSK